MYRLYRKMTINGHFSIYYIHFCLDLGPNISVIKRLWSLPCIVKRLHLLHAHNKNRLDRSVEQSYNSILLSPLEPLPVIKTGNTPKYVVHSFFHKSYKI